MDFLFIEKSHTLASICISPVIWRGRIRFPGTAHWWTEQQEFVRGINYARNYTKSVSSSHRMVFLSALVMLSSRDVKSVLDLLMPPILITLQSFFCLCHFWALNRNKLCVAVYVNFAVLSNQMPTSNLLFHTSQLNFRFSRTQKTRYRLWASLLLFTSLTAQVVLPPM